MSEKNLQLHFKDFIKTDSPLRMDNIKTRLDYVCDLFVHEPKTAKETRLGSLFILGKIENIPKNKYKNLDFLLNLLISVIKREFFSDYERSTIEALESSLNKANLYLADFTEKGNIEWINNLNFICGAFCKNTLHIAQTGKSIIKLFRGATINNIGNKFPSSKKINPLKTFGNIASGTLINGDKVILATKSISNIASPAHLKAFSKKNYTQIVENFKELAEKSNNNESIICLVIEAKPETFKKIKNYSSVSLPQKKSIKNINPAKTKLIISKTFKISKKTLVIIYLLSRLIILKIYKVIKLTAPLFKGLSRSKLFCQIKHRTEKILSLIKKNRFKNKCHKLITNLHNQNKPAFSVAIAIMVLILILPFFIAQKINQHIKVDNFNYLSTEIQEIQKKTDAALVYQDREKAQGLLQKNHVFIANLLTYIEKPPLKNHSDALSLVSIIQEKHQRQQDSIDNVKRIEVLNEILDFSSTGFILNPVGINKIKDALYFFEFESGILYKFDLNNTQQDLTLVFLSAKDELRNMTVLDKEKIVLFGQSGKVYIYNNNTNEHNIYSLDPAISIEEIKAVQTFFSNFYILDAKQSNLVKYSPSSSQDVIKGMNWLPEPIKNLENIQSMAIDGSVYILASDGLITKYFKGKEAGEIKTLTDLAIGEKLKIFTNSDLNNLYISDAQNKRLIVMNKEGKIINQYINNELARLKDFWVTTDEKEIYLLCGKKIYKLDI